MPERYAIPILAAALLGLGSAAVHAGNARQVSAQNQPVREGERARLLEKGRELFVERCARCHNERGDKPLKTGLPLNERELSTEVIARAVTGRLQDRTEDERRAVTLYISSLMKPKDSKNSAPEP